MKKWIVVILFLVSVSYSKASHIVGGELVLVHDTLNFYYLKLNMYYDVINGRAAQMTQLTIAMFGSSTDEVFDTFNLELTEKERVEYLYQYCPSGIVITDKLVYSKRIELDPQEYNDPKGYYFADQLCCRNYTITNIYSQNPAIGDKFAGQTFYLEIPPFIDSSGKRFLNSTPYNFPALNAYACPGRPYFVDFSGEDKDGDSLVYSITTPLSVSSADFSTQFRNLPKPYPLVQWMPGYSLDRITGGYPDLNISKTGVLNVNPVNLGLFVFAVRVEEFRDGKRIGEVIRDFQLFVVDGCSVRDKAPNIEAKKVDELDFNNSENLEFNFENSISDDKRCLEIKIEDLNSLEEEEGYLEEISFEVIPDFPEYDSILFSSLPTSLSLRHDEDYIFDICFDQCPPIDREFIRFSLVALDDSCPVPLIDTLHISVNIKPPYNEKPFFNEGKLIEHSVIETQNGSLSQSLTAFDLDKDSLHIRVQPNNFDMRDYGMTFSNIQSGLGKASGNFTWNYDCGLTSFEELSEFKILFIAEDIDQCNFSKSDTLVMNLDVLLPSNTKPIIRIKEDDELLDDSYRKIVAKPNTRIVLNTFSNDIDKDNIRVEAKGDNFVFEDFNMIFPSKQGIGEPGVNNAFEWEIKCEYFNTDQYIHNPIDSFRFYLLVEDSDYCSVSNQDSITVDIILDPDNNTVPTMEFESNSIYFDLKDSVASIEILNTLNILITGYDKDINDNLSLEIVEINGNTSGYSFNKIESANGYISSELIWPIDCGLLPKGESNVVSFKFKVSDDYCIMPSFTERELIVEINDVVQEELPFLPPNIITLNNDEYNPFFALEWIDESGFFQTTGLKKDNCTEKFESITIINRWGKEIFKSYDRGFKWFAENTSPGIYYYYIKFTDSEFKGFIQIVT